jgi:hypothetical protein
LLNFFRKLFFTSEPTVSITPASPSEILIQHLQSEVTFLREQVKFLTERNAPVSLPPRVVIPQRPKKYNPETKTYVDKTDEEIAQDRQGLMELGII